MSVAGVSNSLDVKEFHHSLDEHEDDTQGCNTSDALEQTFSSTGGEKQLHRVCKMQNQTC